MNWVQINIRVNEDFRYMKILGYEIGYGQLGATCLVGISNARSWNNGLLLKIGSLSNAIQEFLLA